MNEMEEPLIGKIGDQLRAKILSKFQTSAFLAGLAVVVLGVQLSTLSELGKERPPFFAVSIALMFGAVLVYIAALIKLDELTMPKMFWGNKPPERGSSGSYLLNGPLKDIELVELQRRMVLYWYWFSLTATGITGLALLLLLVPKSWSFWEKVSDGATFATVLSAIALSAAYVLVVSRGVLEKALIVLQPND